MKIFIDPGHGGKDFGAVNGYLVEKIMNLTTALALADLLAASGCEVKLARITDVYLSLTERANMANKWGADLFISCHYNAGGGDRGEVIHSVLGGKGKELAGHIANALKAAGQSTVREYSKPSTGGYGDYYTVIANTTMPAVIVEGCFIDNPADRQIAGTPEKQKAIGYAIAKGILSYLGIKNPLPQSAPGYKFNWTPDMHIIEIEPLKFGISVQNKPKRDIKINNFFNLDFFARVSDGTTSVANLADWGNVLSNSKDLADWLNTSGKKLSTIFVQMDGTVGITKTADITQIANLKTAVSGIPIYPNTTLKDIKQEGYFGNEVYDTYHGFLGIRQGKLLYVAAKCGFNTMASIFQALGCSAGIKLDGGGSFILKVNGNIVAATEGNRRINAIGMFE